MIKHLKQFTSDLDRLNFEGSLSYERPYVSSVNGNAYFNKLITGTIENPAVGEVNVQDGDYFDRISVQKSLVIGGNAQPNFLCFPFDITINELREAIGTYKINKIAFGSDFNIYCAINSDGTLDWSGAVVNITWRKYDGTTIIPAGCPINICVDLKQTKQVVAFTLTFKNKTISIGNLLVSVQSKNDSNWYFVGTPFRNILNATGLCTASNAIVVTSKGVARSKNMQSEVATCSGWFEYRGPVPSE